MPIFNGTARAETLRGTSLADSIYGRGGNDSLYGYGGDDVLVGGAGNDLMVGGTGNDRYFVDSWSDRIIESAGQGQDSVFTSVDYALANGVSVETLMTTSSVGTAPINLYGNELANSIHGNAGANELAGLGGADVIRGYGGNDYIVGGDGNDVLIGGAGADTFVFHGAETGDRITDFTSGVDHLYLAYDLVENFDFIGAAAFTGAAGQARFANGRFQIDQNGDGVADFAVTISGPLVEADLILGSPWDY